jgi:hypothetical protein
MISEGDILSELAYVLALDKSKTCEEKIGILLPKKFHEDVILKSNREEDMDYMMVRIFDGW